MKLIQIPASRAWLLLACIFFVLPVHATTLALQSNNWYLMTVPANPSDSTVGELFADDLPASTYGEDWVIFRFDSGLQQYAIPQLTESLQPGDGFWMIQTTGAEVVLDLPPAIEPAVTEASTQCATSACSAAGLPVSTSNHAWAIRGTPHAAQPVNVANLRISSASVGCAGGCDLARAASSGYLSGSQWVFDSATGQYRALDDIGQLVPWQAFWVKTEVQPSPDQLSLLTPGPSGVAIETRNALLGRGINLGNMLEAPAEGDWGLRVQDYYFDLIAEAGFDSVRIPVRWSAHALSNAPYTIDTAFFERIDWVLDQAARTGLVAVLNMHHYEELMDNPALHRARFLALWQQISSRYANRPQNVYFEILNEPTGEFNDNPGLWNTLLAEAVETIRQTNPFRTLIAGPVGWNAIDRLADLVLPDDADIIVTVHYYSPFEFTHQGAGWVNPVPPVGVDWNENTMQLGSGFQNWSWQTSVTALAGFLRLGFESQYAGFNLRTSAPEVISTLNLEVRGDSSLNLMCGDSADLAVVAQIDHTGTEWQAHTIDMSACVSGVRNVVLQNRLPGGQTTDIRAAQLCGSNACQRIISSAGEAVDDTLFTARDWGVANARPVYVGEFGAYSEGEMGARVRWTTRVQKTIQSTSMSSAYWEFGAGFGAYDLGSGVWRAGLLNALISPE